MILTDFFSKQKAWIIRGNTAEVDFTSMLEFSAERSSRLPDEPIEKGSFATYNRVVDPVIITCILAVKGGEAELQNKINRLTTLSQNDEKITLTTPEQTYPSMMLESFDYRRDANNGRGVLYVNLRFKEIREVASQQTTTSVEEPIEEEDCEDGSCVDDVDEGEVNGTAASGAEEEESAKGSGRSILKDILG
jgi:hypothetical protein